MSKLRVHSFAISLDGYGSGPNQSRDNPMGVGGMALHEWALATRTFRQMHGDLVPGLTGEGAAGVDDDFMARGFANIGAWIIGRNMFGPVRGPWPDESWKGWWGDNPPYHTPVFVLTHHARSSITMEGGTTFHFVTEGIHAALERAREGANGRDIDSAVESPQSNNTYAPDSLTRCTSLFPRFFSVLEKHFSPASTL
jgi:dihydrofolate reductase